MLNFVSISLFRLELSSLRLDLSMLKMNKLIASRILLHGKYALPLYDFLHFQAIQECKLETFHVEFYTFEVIIK